IWQVASGLIRYTFRCGTAHAAPCRTACTASCRPGVTQSASAITITGSRERDSACATACALLQVPVWIPTWIGEPSRRSSYQVFVYSRALLRQGVSLPKGMRTPTSFMPVSWHGCGPPLWGWRGPASDGSSGCHVVQVEDLVLRGFRPLFECLQAVVVGGRTDRQSEAVVLEAGLVLLRVLTQNLLRQRGVRLGDRDLVQAVTVEALDGHLRVELLAGTEDHG